MTGTTLRALRRGAAALLAACLALCVAALAMAAASWWLLRPAPGEWQHRVAVGRWHLPLSGPALWRVASHPFMLSLLAGHTWDTRWGPVRLDRSSAVGDDPWVAVCDPCALRRREWGGQALAVGPVRVTLAHGEAGRAHGSVQFGQGPRAVHGAWTGAFQADHVVLTATWRGVPIGNAYEVVKASVPEVDRARIDGRFDLQARLAWPAGTLALSPRVDGFRVEGLGMAALVGAESACGPRPPAGYGRWLPRAVIAAEDQRFLTHTGFDLDELAAAWSLNQGRGAVVRGGSTLSQQLAKLLFTGNDRTPARKLRELLYAVELDRALGKARVLDLYLSLAPWGGGRCGADAAARHLLGKPAHRLSPLEAAWLASLLPGPDRVLAGLRDGEPVDTARVAWITGQMRPAPHARVQAAAGGWRPALESAAKSPHLRAR